MPIITGSTDLELYEKLPSKSSFALKDCQNCGAKLFVLKPRASKSCEILCKPCTMERVDLSPPVDAWKDALGNGQRDNRY